MLCTSLRYIMIKSTAIKCFCRVKITLKIINKNRFKRSFVFFKQMWYWHHSSGFTRAHRFIERTACFWQLPSPASTFLEKKYNMSSWYCCLRSCTSKSFTNRDACSSDLITFINFNASTTTNYLLKYTPGFIIQLEAAAIPFSGAATLVLSL